MEKKLIRAVINQYMDMRKLIEAEGSYVAPNGTCFCIFHDNTHTKSAHFYENDGGGQMFCFAEYRQYTPYDYYKILHPEIDVEQLATKIWDRLSKDQQDYVTQTVNLSDVEKTIPYLNELNKFQNNECNYEQLMESIRLCLGKDETTQIVEQLYNLPKVEQFDDANKYMYYMNRNETQYKLLSAHQIINSVPNIPDFVYQHLVSTGDCILLPNIIDNQVYSLTFRSLKSDKRFLKYGEFSSLIYNMGNFPKDFTYGTPIMIVEGNLDCDVVKELYPYTVATLTATLTNNQLNIITHLTNKVILAFDNDEAGEKGYYISCSRLSKQGIRVFRFNHRDDLKDFGDLIELKRNDIQDYYNVIDDYKTDLRLILEVC